MNCPSSGQLSWPTRFWIVEEDLDSINTIKLSQGGLKHFSTDPGWKINTLWCEVDVIPFNDDSKSPIDELRLLWNLFLGPLGTLFFNNWSSIDVCNIEKIFRNGHISTCYNIPKRVCECNSPLIPINIIELWVDRNLFQIWIQVFQVASYFVVPYVESPQ